MNEATLKKLIDAGLSVTPLNGKIPILKNWQKTRLTTADVYKFKGYNLGVVCGLIGGGVECIDVDTKYDLTGLLWANLKTAINENFERVPFYIAKTPSGGRHIVYKCPKPDGNLKLASRYATEQELNEYNSKTTRKKNSTKDLYFCTIETRGERGQFASAPTPGYAAVSGDLCELPELTQTQRDRLISICRSFCELEKISAPMKQAATSTHTQATNSTRVTPWDAFNDAHTVREIVEGYGWTYAGGSGDAVRMKRPGGKSKSHARIKESKNYFRSWATNGDLPTDENLTPAAIFAHYECGGDFSEAARQLYAKGYGDRYEKQTSHPTAATLSHTQPHAAKDEQNTNDGGLLDNAYFKVLGFELNSKSQQIFVFAQKTSRAVLRYTAAKLTKLNLLTLAPLAWWEANFPGAKSGFSQDVVVDFIVAAANVAGLFDDAKQRGRGCWDDDGRIVWHVGNKCYLDGKARDFSFNTEYLYSVAPALNFTQTTPATNKQAATVGKAFAALGWERGKVGANLAAGWAVIAPFAGLLEWRPHLWISGAAGSGKSWVLRELIRRLIGANCLNVQGNTSEAYVRNVLQRDALPVLFDEGEGETERARITMESILAFARASSTRDGGGIGKMNQDGRAVTFKPNAAFCFCSIAPQMSEQADKTRITVLNLRKAEPEKFKQVLDLVYTFDKKFVNALLTRTLNLLPVLIESIKVIRRVLAAELGAARQSDQLAPLLAGAWLLTSDKVITEERAAKLCNAGYFTEELELSEMPDGLKCLSIIKQHVLKIDFSIERSVGELIDICIDNEAAEGTDDRVSVATALDALQRFGVRIKRTKNKQGTVVISNTSRTVMAALKGTNYAKAHAPVLLQIEGATRAAPLRFAGLKSRGVAIPFKIFD